MPMLAETVDAVIGVDTHRDTHEVEIADPGGQADRDDADQQRQRRVRPAAGLDRRAGARAAGGGLDRGHPQLRHRAGPGAGRGRAAGDRVRAAHPQAPPREGQVRPDRRAPGGAGRAAPGRRPAADAARRRRPRGAADPAGRPAGDHRGPHRADQPAARPAAGRATTPTAGPPAAPCPDAALAALAGARPARRRQPRAGRPPRRDPPPRARAATRPGGSSRTTAPSCRPSSTTSPPA